VVARDVVRVYEAVVAAYGQVGVVRLWDPGMSDPC
jgi:hypothetical protein